MGRAEMSILILLVSSGSDETCYTVMCLLVTKLLFFDVLFLALTTELLRGNQQYKYTCNK